MFTIRVTEVNGETRENAKGTFRCLKFFSESERGLMVAIASLLLIGLSNSLLQCILSSSFLFKPGERNKMHENLFLEREREKEKERERERECELCSFKRLQSAFRSHIPPCVFFVSAQVSGLQTTLTCLFLFLSLSLSLSMSFSSSGHCVGQFFFLTGPTAHPPSPPPLQ